MELNLTDTAFKKVLDKIEQFYKHMGFDALTLNAWNKNAHYMLRNSPNTETVIIDNEQRKGVFLWLAGSSDEDNTQPDLYNNEKCKSCPAELSGIFVDNKDSFFVQCTYKQYVFSDGDVAASNKEYRSIELEELNKNSMQL